MKFNKKIDKSLVVFVGASVNAVRTESIANIEKILSFDSAFQTTKGIDKFRWSFNCILFSKI